MKNDLAFCLGPHIEKTNSGWTTLGIVDKVIGKEIAKKAITSLADVRFENSSRASDSQHFSKSIALKVLSYYVMYVFVAFTILTYDL